MIDFYSKRRIFYVFSLLLMIIGAIVIVIKGGFVLDIQFQGGAVIEIAVPNDDFDLNRLQNTLSDKLDKVINAQKSFYEFDAREQNNNSYDDIYNLDVRIETDEVLTVSEIDKFEDFINEKYGNVDIKQTEYAEDTAPFVAKFNILLPDSAFSNEESFKQELPKIEKEIAELLNKEVSTVFSYVYNPDSYNVRRDILNLKVPSEDLLTAEEIAEIKTIVSEELDFIISENSNDGDFNISNISSVVGSEMLRNSTFAIIVASLLILVYIWFRFRTISGLSAGVSAVLALVHDAIMMIVVYGILRYPINENFIAAVLTIIGYSINDTIVIFDRIRENTARHKDLSPARIANMSVTQSLSRSINTTVCVLISLVVLYLFAKVNQLASMELFSFPLIIGMICGCYTSIFLTAPFWAAWQHKKQGLPMELDKEVAKKA